MNNKARPKFFLMTTVSMSLNFFKEQINHLNQFYDVTLISSPSAELKEIAKRENANYKGIKMNRIQNLEFINGKRSFSSNSFQKIYYNNM